MRLQRAAKTIIDEQTFEVTFDAIKNEWKMWLKIGEEIFKTSIRQKCILKDLKNKKVTKIRHIIKEEISHPHTMVVILRISSKSNKIHK